MAQAIRTTPSWWRHTLGSLLLLSLASAVNAGIYRWVDANGKVHYGDKPPAIEKKLGHSKLDSQGRVRQTIKRPKTAAELRIEREQKQALAMQQKKAKEQRRKDQVLLQTFSSVDELKSEYNHRLNALAHLKQMAIDKQAKLQQQLDSTERRLLDFGQEKPEVQARKRKLRETLEGVQARIDRLDKQAKATQDTFDRSLARFKILRPE